MTSGDPFPGGSDASDRATALWACGALERAFPGGGGRTVVPWPSAPRQRGRKVVDDPDVLRLLVGPPTVADLDPRRMYATQTFCVSSHVAYYRTGVWERTGQTSADRGRAHNRYPLVWVDNVGRQILLAGHHRSLAALIDSRPVRCRVLRSTGDDSSAVLPLLLVGEGCAVAHTVATDPATAAHLVQDGRTALVPDRLAAERTLVTLGLPADVVDDRMTMATTGRCMIAA